jgi:predicted O-methyltransferase YrrM
MYPKILQKFDTCLVKNLYRYANRRWYGNPLTKTIKASEESYLNLWEKAKAESFPIIDDYERKTGFSIDPVFFHELALHTQVVIKKSDILYQHGRLLYTSLRKFIKDRSLKNVNIVETGTARGFSSVCMAKALADSEVKGKILSYDVLPHHHKMFWNCIDDHKGKKTRAELLESYKDLCETYIIFHQGNSLTEMKKTCLGRVHFAFLDGGHEYFHVMNEFRYIAPFQKTGDVIVFDDYTPDKFSGVVKAVDEICNIYKYRKEIIKVNDSRAYVIAEKE